MVNYVVNYRKKRSKKFSAPKHEGNLNSTKQRLYGHRAKVVHIVNYGSANIPSTGMAGILAADHKKREN